MRIFSFIILLLGLSWAFVEGGLDIQTELEHIVKNSTSVGIAVGFIDEGTISYYNYGKTSLSGQEYVSEDTLFEIASITKLFTATLLVNLADKGMLSLDDSVSLYLPEISNPELEQVSLRELASHISGLPRLPPNLPIEDAPTEKTNPYKRYHTADLYECLSEITLGEKTYQYSNLGMGLLGHILTKVTLQSYEELVQEVICRPLGMNDTAIHVDPSKLSKGHWMRKEAGYWGFDVLEGCGALRSNVKDLIRFAAANLDMFPNSELTHVFLQTHDVQYQVNESFSLGFAWIITDGIFWHNGTSNGFSSFIGLDKENHRAVVVLSNSEEGVSVDLGMKILGHDSIFKEESNEHIETPDSSSLNQFVGEYFVEVPETDRSDILLIDVFGDQFIIGLNPSGYNGESYHLDFDHGNVFHIREYPNVRLEFQDNMDLVIHQDEESYVAHKLDSK